MREKGVCPGCGRRCDLTSPGCGRGREFATSGVFPERGYSGEIRLETCPPRDRGAEINDRLILDLRDISRIMRMQYEGRASQKRILIILLKSGAMTQKALTERLGIQPGSASEILAKLEGAGLITRTRNEADRRTTDIRLTDMGEALALEAAGQRRKRHEEMFSCLTAEEKGTLFALLETLRTDWESRYGRPPAQDGPDRYGEHGGHGGSRHGRHGGHGGSHHGGHGGHGGRWE